ncbi:MAG: helix-turn-helix domain-containing protein [Pseudomonadota bacterium]
MSAGSKTINGRNEAIEHAKGAKNVARSHDVYVHHIDVRAVREGLSMSQEEFAIRFGFSLGTLRNWEQGRRHPHGPARVLLKVIMNDYQAVEKALATG